jgi:hypothetical protein
MSFSKFFFDTADKLNNRTNVDDAIALVKVMTNLLGTLLIGKFLSLRWFLDVFMKRGEKQVCGGLLLKERLNDVEPCFAIWFVVKRCLCGTTVDGDFLEASKEL